MENLVHLLITLRGPVWRVRILSSCVIRWRSYRVSEYPTPESVARRCAEGLIVGKDNQHSEGYSNSKEDVTQHVSPLRVRWECWGRLEATYQA